MKHYLDMNVNAAARRRIAEIYDNFEAVCVAFSGGKDSSALLHLAIEVARERGRLPVDAMLVDLEAQYAHTIEYCLRMAECPDVRMHWVCLPIHLRNAVSQVRPHWVCWDPGKIADWVRPLPAHSSVVSDPSAYPWFRVGMEFEEFTPQWGAWFGQGRKTAILVGIRTDESLNRWRTIRSESKTRWNDRAWTTVLPDTGVVNAYPIYDWGVEDIWTAHGRFGWDYNRVYDLMHLAGVSLHQMRLCQPFGDDQRRGLWLYKILEPETWARLVCRVEGANFGNRWVGTSGNVLGNIRITLPPGHTWKSYAKFLLDTMPPHTADHYRRKILTFLRWWRKHRRDFVSPEVMAELRRLGLVPDWTRGIPDAVEGKLESKSMRVLGKAVRLPSWRRICKVLLKNDYWCKGLSFSQTKREMESQLRLIAKYTEEI